METKNIILEALGEASALFMSQDARGIDIIMPSEELIRIAEEATQKIASL